MSIPDKILFPDIDPANPLPEDAPIVRYMSIQAFLMLLAGNVFIPMRKTGDGCGPRDAGIAKTLLARSRRREGKVEFERAQKAEERFHKTSTGKISLSGRRPHLPL